VFTSWFTLLSELASAQVSANEIIARRMLGFAEATAKGRLADDPELTRMVVEKWAAMASGAAAMPAAMLALAVKPDTMLNASAALTRAAMTPALVRLKSNSRRLRRKKR
jgi:hypothetical protein